MADTLKLRGGTTSQNNSFTGSDREVTVDTTKKTLVVHDGSTAGGSALMKESGGNAASSVGIGTGGTNAININSNQKVGIGITSNVAPLNVKAETDGIFHIRPIGSIASGPAGSGVGLDVLNDAGSAVKDLAIRGSTTIFKNASSESMRIDSSGRLLVGTTTEGHVSADNLTINDSGNGGITIRTGTNSNGAIFFSDATSGNAEYDGFVQYNHSATPFMQFGVNQSTRMILDSNGNLGIGETAGLMSNGKLTVKIDTNKHIGFNGTQSELGSIPALAAFQDNGSLADLGFRGNSLKFATTTSERMRIDSAGNVLIPNDTGKLQLGANQDVSLYHDGDNSYLIDTGTGSLILGGNRIRLRSSNGENGIEVIEDGAVQLFFNNEQKLTTTSDGISIDGRVGINQTSFATTDTKLSVSQLTGHLEVGFISKNDSACVLNFGDPDNYNIGRLKYNNGDNSMRFDVNSSERMRIASDGTIFLSSNTNLTGGGSAGLYVSGSQMQCFRANQGDYIIFKTTSDSIIGTIRNNGDSSTNYNTSSDYRLKENQTAIADGITRIKTLKPYRFNWKSNSSTIVDGFFAHEVTAVPEAVSGTKDAVAVQADVDEGLANKVGDPVYQSIDHSKLVPLLTAALQEAISKIETLETKVAALEAA